MLRRAKASPSASWHDRFVMWISYPYAPTYLVSAICVLIAITVWLVMSSGPRSVTRHFVWTPTDSGLVVSERANPPGRAEQGTSVIAHLSLQDTSPSVDGNLLYAVRQSGLVVVVTTIHYPFSPESLPTRARDRLHYLSWQNMLDDLSDAGLITANLVPQSAFGTTSLRANASNFGSHVFYTPPSEPWWPGIAIASVNAILAFLLVISLCFVPTWPARLRMERALKRGARGKCPTCEYDLKGLIADTCPECGEVIPVPGRSPARDAS